MASKDGTAFPDRGRFMGYASRVMRGLIIDHARSRNAMKRGGQFHITSSGMEVEQPADDRELRSMHRHGRDRASDRRWPCANIRQVR